jgi:hypothetical protein
MGGGGSISSRWDIILELRRGNGFGSSVVRVGFGFGFLEIPFLESLFLGVGGAFRIIGASRPRLLLFSLAI